MVRVPMLFSAALFTGGLIPAGQLDATTVLADMRQALGGEAIAAVRAFSVKTTEERFIFDRSLSTRVEWMCVLPDRFIQVRRLPTLSTPLTQTRGFQGDEVIELIEAPGGSVRDRRVASRGTIALARQHFSRQVIAMLGITPAYPLDAVYVVQETLDGKPVHVLELTAADGYQSRLYVDAATHLPRMISWIGEPEPRPLAMRTPATPPAGLPPVERRIFFSDYKNVGGLNWPHRFREVVAKQTVSETRLGKFTINPTIDLSRFVSARSNRHH